MKNLLPLKTQDWFFWFFGFIFKHTAINNHVEALLHTTAWHLNGPAESYAVFPVNHVRAVFAQPPVLAVLNF